MAAVDVSVLHRSFALVRARALVRDTAFLPKPALDTASEYVIGRAELQWGEGGRVPGVCRCRSGAYAEAYAKSERERGYLEIGADDVLPQHDENPELLRLHRDPAQPAVSLSVGSCRGDRVSGHHEALARTVLGTCLAASGGSVIVRAVTRRGRAVYRPR
jgi:hypothetical protein